MPRDVDVSHALVFFSACCAIAELRLASTSRDLPATGLPGDRLHAVSTHSSVSHLGQSLLETN